MCMVIEHREHSVKKRVLYFCLEIFFNLFPSYVKKVCTIFSVTSLIRNLSAKKFFAKTRKELAWSRSEIKFIVKRELNTAQKVLDLISRFSNFNFMNLWFIFCDLNEKQIHRVSFLVVIH